MVAPEAAPLALVRTRRCTTRRTRTMLFGVALSLAVPGIAEAQAGASLSGRVLVESTEDPIAGVEISIAGQMLSARSDSAGRFSLSGIHPGRHVVLVRAIGFAERSTTLYFVGGQEIETDFTMQPLGQSLAKVEVKATPPSGDNPRIAEFDERRKIGLGRFLTQAELEKAEGRKMIDVLTSRFPGLRSVRLRNTRALASGRGVNGPRSTVCFVRIVFDGVLGANLVGLDEMDPSTIAAVEYYTPTNLPPQFNFEGNNPCGTLVLWSRWKPRD
jgi:hypothetical protein